LEELEDKGELCQQVVLSGDYKHGATDWSQGTGREAGNGVQRQRQIQKAEVQDELGCGSGGLAQLHASGQALRRVKREKEEPLGELEDKDELCQQVVLSEDRKNATIDRLKVRLRRCGRARNRRAGRWCCCHR
jgi:hypothetical protein